MIISLLSLALTQPAVDLQPDAVPSAPPPLEKCEGAGFEAFDFWIGDWDIYQTADEALPNGISEKVGSSTVKKIHADCAILEISTSDGASQPRSVSGYDAKTDEWHKLWTGLSNEMVQLKGRIVRMGMVFTGTRLSSGADDQDVLIQITYTPNELDGSVRQRGLVSYDQGETWAPSFDLTYRPKAEAQAEETQ